MNRNSTSLQFLRIVFLVTAGLTVSTWGYSQVRAEGTVSLDNVTKIFAILSTILGLCVGALQLWIANKIAKVKEEFNAALILVKTEFHASLEKESKLLETKIDNSIEKMQGKVANKDDISSIKELVSLGMKNMEQQITIQSQQIKLDMIQSQFQQPRQTQRNESS